MISLSTKPAGGPRRLSDFPSDNSRPAICARTAETKSSKTQNCSTSRSNIRVSTCPVGSVHKNPLLAHIGVPLFLDVKERASRPRSQGLLLRRGLHFYRASRFRRRFLQLRP